MRTLLAALTLLAPASASAADASLEKLSGPVHVRPAGEKSLKLASDGQPLSFGDEVRTGPAGLAHVVFPGGAVVLVKERSAFTLTGKRRKVELSFLVGEFLIGLGTRLKRGHSFRVRTPSAVASVRGTLFWGRSDAEKKSTYACFGHEIEVTAQGKTVSVKAGQSVSIPYGEEPSEPAKADIPLSYLDSFAVDSDLQGLKALVEAP